MCLLYLDLILFTLEVFATILLSLQVRRCKQKHTDTTSLATILKYTYVCRSHDCIRAHVRLGTNRFLFGIPHFLYLHLSEMMDQDSKYL